MGWETLVFELFPTFQYRVKAYYMGEGELNGSNVLPIVDLIELKEKIKK